MTTPELDFLPLAPALFLVGMGMVVLLFGAIYKRASAKWLLLFTLLGLAAAGLVAIKLWGWEGAPTVLGGMLVVDQLAVLATLAIVGVGAMAALLGADYFDGEEPGEFYALLLFATAGMTLLVSAADLVMVFLALEVLSLSLYVLVGFTLRRAAGEASLKYFLLGAFSAAFFLYGVAMTYGATGTTSITGIARALSGVPLPGSLALAGLGLLGVGLAFKVAAVPFHMWTPDVYQGAPTPVTGFMAAGTKIAAFVAMIRVLDVAFAPLQWNWQPVIIGLAVLTMVLGAFLAIPQTNIKRMLAYSSIMNAGFVLVGIAAGGAAIGVTLFYLLAYAIAVLGAVAVVMVVSHRRDEAASIEAFRGLSKRKPALAGVMTLFLLSLTGIPPAVGFISKVGIFAAATNAGLGWLVLIALLCAVVATYVYIRVIVLMYMDEPTVQASAEPIRITTLTVITVTVPAFLVLLLGILPNLVAGFLEHASVLRW